MERVALGSLFVKEGTTMVAKEILESIGQADSERTLKAVQGLTSGTYQVSITRQDEWRVSGVVANGKAYDVSVGVDSFFACSCADFAYRQAICKHMVMLTMVATQEQPREEECDHKAPYGSVTGCEKCGSKYLHEGEHRPNLKLARVREGFYSGQ